jgi:hypothetical protein
MVVPRERARSRIEAALDARQSEDTVVISRIDAYGSTNVDWEAHVERGRMFADAGVDLIWPEMPDPSRDDAVRYAEALHETHPEAKMAFNYSSSFAWSEEEDPLTFAELGDPGSEYVFITLYALHSGAHAVYETRRPSRRTTRKRSSTWRGATWTTKPRATTSCRSSRGSRISRRGSTRRPGHAWRTPRGSPRRRPTPSRRRRTTTERLPALDLWPRSVSTAFGASERERVGFGVRTNGSVIRLPDGGVPWALPARRSTSSTWTTTRR